jgi:hypothetical protein
LRFHRCGFAASAFSSPWDAFAVRLSDSVEYWGFLGLMVAPATGC